MLRADGQQILVLAPHPDDETFGCGGTLRLLATAGAAIDVAYLTRGELGSEAPEATTAESREQLAARRTDEARNACRILGVRDVHFFHGQDGRVAEQPDLTQEIGALIVQREYHRIFCPWPQDGHPDHQATFRWLAKALKEYPAAASVWLYEVWTPLIPSTWVPIDAAIESKAAAARAHQSQLECLDYLAGFRGLAAYRALRCAGTKFAEAFQTTTSERLRESVAHG